MSSPQCENCPNKVYEHQNSTTRKEGTHKKTRIDIGKNPRERLTVEGFSSIDDVCLTAFVWEKERTPKLLRQEKQCLKEFEFFTATKMSSDIYFDDISGQLGLGFDKPDNGDSFITSLKK